MKNVLIIGQKLDENREFGSAELMVEKLNTLENNKFKYHFSKFEDLIFVLSNDKTEVKDNRNNMDISDYDFVVFRDWFLRYKEQAQALAMYLESKNIPYFNKEALKNRSSSKLTQYVFMALNNISLPKTVYSSNENLRNYVQKENLIWPMVLKQRGGRRGLLNFLVKNPEETTTILNDHNNTTFVLQEFIPNDHDLRIIFYKYPRLVMKRARADNNTHLNNTSRGGNATLLDVSYIPEQFYSDMNKISEKFGRTFTGIDLIYNPETGSHTYLEINNMPQMETGSFVNEKLNVLQEAIAEEINDNMLKHKSSEEL